LRFLYQKSTLPQLQKPLPVRVYFFIFLFMFDDFLPADYSAPKTNGRYTKLQDGDNVRLRILTSPVMFWEWWSQDNKPIRSQYIKDGIVSIPANARDSKWKFVWAMVVWNYTTEKTEIWSVTQSSIRKYLEDCIHDPDIWNPKAYDLKITRTGSWMDTEYSITALLRPENMKKIDDDILAEAETINLKWLISWENPFASVEK